MSEKPESTESIPAQAAELSEFQERYQHLLGETAKIPWKDLQLFYAKGSLVKVCAGLDLVEVAARVSLDAEQAVSHWVAKGLLQKVEDDDARVWFSQSADLWAVVVSPWVLVQSPEAREQAKLASERSN